ncbi:MAG: DUF4391 domain-containing protein [Phycisphaerae bacterium]
MHHHIITIYPLLLVLACESRITVSVASKRFSQSDNSKIVAEELYSTEWLNPDSATASWNSICESRPRKGNWRLRW